MREVDCLGSDSVPAWHDPKGLKGLGLAPYCYPCPMLVYNASLIKSVGFPVGLIKLGDVSLALSGSEIYVLDEV